MGHLGEQRAINEQNTCKSLNESRETMIDSILPCYYLTMGPVTVPRMVYNGRKPSRETMDRTEEEMPEGVLTAPGIHSGGMQASMTKEYVPQHHYSSHPIPWLLLFLGS